MISIQIRPARQIFGGRKQYRFEIVAANGRKIDPRDTYANPGDILAIFSQLVMGPQGVRVVDPDGSATVLREGER